MPKRIHPIIIIALLAAVVFLALYLGSPDSEAWPVKCPLYSITKWQCPLCGTQRAIHEMLHGNMKQAWDYNPALWIATPYIIISAIAQVIPATRQSRIIKTLCGNIATLIFIALLAVWGIIRNIV